MVPTFRSVFPVPSRAARPLPRAAPHPATPDQQTLSMSQKDVYFLGLLALAYVYLDRSGSRTLPPSPRRSLPVPVRRLLPVPVHPRPGCPKVSAHPVALRPDGAVWCRGCDQAFFPRVPEWDRVLASA